MVHHIHKEIINYLLLIYHKETKVLPQWDVIADVVQLAKMEPTFENVRFATQLFYVLEDLLHPVKHEWIEIEAIDEPSKTINIVRHEMFENVVGVKKYPSQIHEPDEILWDSLYKNKSVEELNNGVQAYPVSKFEWHIFKEKSEETDNTDRIQHWVNTDRIKNNYKSAFQPVINTNIPRLTFERFIERLPEFYQPYIISNIEDLAPKISVRKTLSNNRMKHFDTEIREAFNKKYVKVFLKDKSRLPEIRVTLRNLPSVNGVNITKNKELDLTVYPGRVYSVEETEKEIIDTLDVVFSGRPAAPIIKDDVLVGVSDEIYAKILKMVYLFGKNLEKLTNLHSKFDEEGYREYFLPYLNMMSESHTATGETFNKIGKTDILIQNQQGENVFIAECKIWSGAENLTAAIDQLFERYVTWRDEKLALIIFNKSVKGFSSIIEKGMDTLKSHPSYKETLDRPNDSCASFVFQHPEDTAKSVRLELIMFNCFS